MAATSLNSARTAPPWERVFPGLGARSWPAAEEGAGRGRAWEEISVPFSFLSSPRKMLRSADPRRVTTVQSLTLCKLVKEADQTGRLVTLSYSRRVQGQVSPRRALLPCPTVLFPVKFEACSHACWLPWSDDACCSRRPAQSFPRVSLPWQLSRRPSGT